MDMDQYAGVELRKNIQKQGRHIGIHQYAMRAIDKECIASLELIKQGTIQILDSSPHNPIAKRVHFGSRLRINGNDLGVQLTPRFGIPAEFRRIPGADLEITFGTKIRHEAVQSDSVKPREKAIVPMREQGIGGAVRNQDEVFLVLQKGL